jgi:hypothetical protein
MFIKLKFLNAPPKPKIDRRAMAHAAKHGGPLAEKFQQKLAEWTADSSADWAAVKFTTLGKAYDFWADGVATAVNDVFSDTATPHKKLLAKQRAELLLQRKSFRQQHHTRTSWRRSFLMPEAEASRLPRWPGTDELNRIQKELRSLKKREEAMTREAIENDLQESILLGDSKETWRLARMRASFKLGPKNKFMSRLRCHTPSLDDWQEFLAKPGPEGGCNAHPLELDEIAEHEDEPIAPIMSEHLAQASSYIEKRGSVL